MKHSALLSCLMAICMLAPCSELRAEVTENKSKANTPKTYTYKHSAGKPREMEIHFPPNHDTTKAKVPGVILFHGGSWMGGGRGLHRKQCAYFASRGLVCATAEYQMLDKASIAKLPKGESFKRVCVTDAKSAIRWFKQHADELGIDPKRIITGGSSAGGHISALATMNPGLNDPADPMDIDTSVVAYLWFNPAFASDEPDPEVGILHHLKSDLPPAIVMFGSEDNWLEGWDRAYAKWRSLGTETIDYQLAPGQVHTFWRKGVWLSVCIIAADEFLVKHGLLTGKPTLPAPATGEKMIPATEK